MFCDIIQVFKVCPWRTCNCWVWLFGNTVECIFVALCCEAVWANCISILRKIFSNAGSLSNAESAVSIVESDTIVSKKSIWLLDKDTHSILEAFRSNVASVVKFCSVAGLLYQQIAFLLRHSRLPTYFSAADNQHKITSYSRKCAAIGGYFYRNSKAILKIEVLCNMKVYQKFLCNIINTGLPFMCFLYSNKIIQM